MDGLIITRQLTDEGGQHDAVKKDRTRLRPIATLPSAAQHRLRTTIKLRVALIDPRALTRASFSSLLTASARGFAVVPYSSAESLLNGLSQTEFQLVLLNIGGAVTSEKPVAEEIRQLREALPQIPLVILSDREEAPLILEAFRQGVQGYLPTTLNAPVMVSALFLVQAGGTFIPAAALGIVSGDARSDATARETLIDQHYPTSTRCEGTQHFTARQRQVLELLRQGKSNKFIAYELDIKESTVKIHIRHLMKKLHATNRTQAAILAERLA